jgi:hypothetical protein
MTKEIKEQITVEVDLVNRAAPRVTTQSRTDGLFVVRCTRCGSEAKIEQFLFGLPIGLDDLISMEEAFEEQHRRCS